MICYLFPEPTYLFFSSNLPGILYYSHIPATVVALLTGLFVFWNGRKFLLNQLLLIIAVCFSLWTLSNLIAWTNIHSNFILFIWSFFGLLSSLISIFCIYFIYVFLDKKDITFRLKTVFLALLAPVLALAPTSFSLRGFNITRCDAFGFEVLPFELYYTSLGVLAMVWILVLLVYRYRRAASELKKQIVLMGIGIEFFLFSFFTMGFLGSYLTSIGILPDSELEMYGLFGMIVFMVYIGIFLVRFKTFNVGLIASQALVVALMVLIGSQLTFVRSTTNFILTLIALVLTAAIGTILIRSVKREIAQRELLEELTQKLEETNERQEVLIHFIGHEVKGFLTKDAGAFASLCDGDFGPLPDGLKPFVCNALEQSRSGARSVTDLLTASNQKKGTITYAKEPFDLKALAAEITEKAKSMAEEKKLALTFSADEAGEPYTMSGDKEKIGDHVLRNIIENSIHYTLAGSVAVSLKKEDNKFVFTVKDTGIGITEEDKKRLFTEGGHGKDSQKVNVHSTGYGLYIAKNIVVAHGGTITAESEGEGKGATFTVEFPGQVVG